MTRVEKAEKQVEKLFQDYQSRWREYAKCADKAGGADHVEVCNMYMHAVVLDLTWTYVHACSSVGPHLDVRTCMQ